MNKVFPSAAAALAYNSRLLSQGKAAPHGDPVFSVGSCLPTREV